MKYYVCLKTKHLLNQEESNKVIKMELESPEERFRDHIIEPSFIEIYKEGSKEDCNKFISEIKDLELSKNFHIVENS